MESSQYAPKYRKLEFALREQIENQLWPSGHQIPTEMELCRIYKVSKTTIRAAIDELVLAGLIERVQGKGTFVTRDRKPTTLTLVGWGPAEQPFADIWRDIQKAFACAHQHIDLNIIGIPYRRLRGWLLDHIAQGRAPDIAQIDSAWDMEFAAQGFTQPLDDLMGSQAQEEIEPALLRWSTYRGNLYAWPEAPMPFCLYCNKALRSDAGFNRPPDTLEELAEQARAISTLNPATDARRAWGITLDTFPWVWAGNAFLPILYNFGGSEMDEQGRVTIESDAAAEALEWCRGLANSGALGPLGASLVDARRLFGQERTGFYIDHPGGRAVTTRHSRLGEEYTDRIELVLVPRQKLPYHESIAEMWDFVVFRQSQRQREAAIFLEWVTREPSIVGRYFQITGGLPPSAVSMREERFRDRFSAPTLRQMATARRPFVARPDKQIELAEVIAYMVRNVVIDGVPVRQALEEAARIMRVIVGQPIGMESSASSASAHDVWQT